MPFAYQILQTNWTIPSDEADFTPMNPPSPFEELARILEQRLAIIADREWAARNALEHLGALRTISEKLDFVTNELPKPLPGELAHYLERRSLDKALAWIRSGAH